MSEQDVINRIWPKIGEASNKQKLKDAVMDPSYDGCYYGNPINGYGQDVALHRGDKYVKYNSTWSNKISWGGSTPSSIVLNVSKPNTNYAGNYIYESNNGWKNPFTIVTRANVGLESKSRFYVGATGQNRKLPGVFDYTNGIAQSTDTSKHIYIFKNKQGEIKFVNQYPSIMGKYTLEVQTQPIKELYRLPGTDTKEVEVLPKGYSVSFKRQIDKNANLENLNIETDFEQKPTSFDADVKRIFNIDMYLESNNYTIPKPKYDENKYIFEGWEVREQHVKVVGTNTETYVETYDLNANQDGTYSYTPRAVGEHAVYLLNSEIVAKLRTRKTLTANVGISLVDGGKEVENAINVTSTQKSVSDNNAEHTYTEEITDDTQFITTLDSSYAYEFLGWSDAGNNNYAQYGKSTTFKPSINWNSQTDQHKTQNYTANYKGKSYQIVFDGNGGTSSGQKTKTQDTTYYKDVNLDSNSFTRNGYTFLGWSTNKNATQPKYKDTEQVYNLPIEGKNKADKYPEEITLYAVWKSPHATVSIEDSKDTIWIEGYKNKAIASGIYTQGSNQNYTVYEVIRFYLDIDTTDNLDQSKLDKSKFYVVWERSKDGGKTYEKISPTNTSGFFTKAFSDNQWNGFRKAVFDEEKQQWFVPLFIRNNHYPSKDSFYGTYRVNVAYDDPKATEKVTSENDFYNGSGNTGWTTSNPVEVKVIQTFETVVSIPASVTLENKTESNPDGTTKEVIQSTHTSNKVTVNQIEHSLTGKTDYDWNTPNTTMNNTTNGNTYWNSLYKEYTRKKPFEVSINWDKTLSDSTSQYTIPNIEMYSAADLGSMTKDKPIATGTKATFSYDGTEQNKTLFDFYLKGDKPNNLPYGTTFKGVITFRFTNI